jgi:ankyrin repeat protein
LLLEQKTNIDAQDDQGRTALRRAVTEKRLNIVTTLLISGALVNLQDTDQKTPLHEAACSGHEGFVRALLKYGADPVARDGSGKSSLDYTHALRAEVNSVASLGNFDGILSAFDEHAFIWRRLCP